MNTNCIAAQLINKSDNLKLDDTEIMVESWNVIDDLEQYADDEIAFTLVGVDDLEQEYTMTFSKQALLNAVIQGHIITMPCLDGTGDVRISCVSEVPTTI